MPFRFLIFLEKTGILFFETFENPGLIFEIKFIYLYVINKLQKSVVCEYDLF